MLIHWIWFATRPGLSDRQKGKLLQHFRDPEEIYFADPGAFAHIEGLTQEQIESLQDKVLIPAEEILDACDRENIRVLTFQDAAYPKRLKNIPDPPTVLYYKGKLPDFDGLPLIGVVGTRKASPYGLTAAKRLGYQIARCGGIVVSGMAFGIDSMAMSGALTAGKCVIGILGCGADIVYPPSNKGLFADTERYGCILSEFPPGTPPYGWNFPKRNRIISGMSCGVLVVEAPEKSGALSTANHALEHGRDVFAVPANIDVATATGSNRLLREGAILVGSGWDVMSEYQAQFPDKIRRSSGGDHQTAYADEVEQIAKETAENTGKVAQKAKLPTPKSNKKEKSNKKVVDKEAGTTYSDVNKPETVLSADARKIVDALRDGERLVDDVIAECGLSASSVLSNLTVLELKGIVRRLPGKRVALN